MKELATSEGMLGVNSPAVSNQLGIVQSCHPQQRYTFNFGSFISVLPNPQKYKLLKSAGISTTIYPHEWRKQGEQCSTTILRPKVSTAHCHGNPKYLQPSLKLSIPDIKIMALADSRNGLLTTGFLLISSLRSGG